MVKQRFQRKPTLKTVILTMLIAVAVIFVLTVGIVLTSLFKKSIEHAKGEDIKDAYTISMSLTESFDYLSQLLSFTQESLSVIDYQRGSDLITGQSDHILTTMLDLTPEAHCAWLILKDGVYFEDAPYIKEFIRQNGEITESFSIDARILSDDPDKAPWYYEPLLTGETFLDTAELYKYSVAEEPVYAATISMPVSSNGEIIGVCGIDVLYSHILDAIYDLYHSQNREMILLIQNMTILHAFNDTLINKNLSDLSFESIDKMHDAMQRGEVFSGEMLSPLTNEKVFLYLQPITVGIGAHQQSLYLQIATPISELNRDIYNITFVIIIANFICILFIVSIIFFSANRVVQPIRDLTGKARQVASGDFSADIFYDRDYHHNDDNEIVTLRRAFNEMLQVLHDNLHAVENRVQERTWELNQLNTYIKLLIETTSNISILTDRNLDILFCSDSYPAMVGAKDSSEIIGRSFSSVHYGFSDGDYYGRYKTRISRILSGEDRFSEDEIVTLRSGETRLYRIIYSKIIDDENNFAGVIIVMRDLTDVRQEEANRRVDEMLSSSMIACYVWDEDGRIVAYNKESAHTFGIPDDVTPEVFSDMYYSVQPELQPDGRKTETAKMALISEALEKGFAQTNGRLAKSDATPIYVSVTVARISWISGYRMIVYFYDMTELMSKEAQIQESARREREAEIQKEAAQASNNAKSAFLANMSHEIRTPMNSILGFSELAIEEVISPKVKEYLIRIMDNSKWLLQIINNILDISKVESGNMELEKIPFDLSEILATCKSIIMPQAIERNIQLQFHDGTTPIRKKLLGDPTRLRQVLLNLLSNAVKFTEDGAVDLYTDVTSCTDDTITILFRVKDSGIGMTPEEIIKVSEPFIQADASTTRKYGGTGLGLAISKTILELMGSKLKIESSPGAGTQISFEVTVGSSGDIDDAPETVSGVSRLDKPMFKGVVLVCEDNRMNQKVITEHLARVGLSIDIAENGLEGVNKVKQRAEKGEAPYDLIFMDIHMPVMDGFEAAPKIIEMGTGAPVVAMTANIMIEDRDLYKTLGMDGYVGKPFTAQELWQCLLKHLNPVGFVKTESNDETIQNRLKTEFVRSNQNRYEEIEKALGSADIALAHRLAHNLKSNAGLIGKTILQKAAAEVEKALEDGNDKTTNEQMALLQNELELVLVSLKPFMNITENTAQREGTGKEADMTAALELFRELEPLLSSGSPESLNLIDRLRDIPETSHLIEQIEDFYFGAALTTLLELRAKMFN